MRWLLLTLLILLAGCEPPSEPPSGMDLQQALGGEASGFLRAERSRAFRFPEDHLAHPGFRNEWWYLTGNLQDQAGRRYGYQVTFFRIALLPQLLQRASRWGGDQLWMAHLALTDVARGEHMAEERILRQGIGLAGIQADPFRLWVGDWALSGAAGFPWKLELPGSRFQLQLELTPLRPVTLQGEAGLSRKGARPGNASYYYSITRLQTRGSLSRDGEASELSGLSWLDREWSSSALDPGQVGWDWFALQFDNGDDLMLYRMRRSDGSEDPHSSGVLRRAGGELLKVTPNALGLRPERVWQAGDGRRYPVAWSLRLPGAQRRLRVEPLLDDQQMPLSVRYWEGAVRVMDGEAEIGRGYLELAGY